jgi:hypothetical protein
MRSISCSANASHLRSVIDPLLREAPGATLAAHAAWVTDHQALTYVLVLGTVAVRYIAVHQGREAPTAARLVHHV